MSEKTTNLAPEQAARAAALDFSAGLLRQIRASATGIGSSVLTKDIDLAEVVALSQYVLNGELDDYVPEETVTLDDEEFVVPAPVAAALHKAWADLRTFPDIDGPRSVASLKADLSGVALPKRSGAPE